MEFKIPQTTSLLSDRKAVQAASVVVTAESLIAEAEEARAQAMTNGREGNAVNAIKVKSVLSGKWVERAEIGSPGQFDAMSDDELERVLVEQFGWPRFCAGARDQRRIDRAEWLGAGITARQ